MIEVLRPVRPGILIGLSGFIFGIGWAFFLILAMRKYTKASMPGQPWLPKEMRTQLSSLQVITIMPMKAKCFMAKLIWMETRTIAK